MSEISPNSIVESGAELGEGVRIGPFCHIGPNVKLGRNCIVESNVSIVGRTEIGENCHIFPLTVIGTTLDDDAEGVCRIGNANNVREHVTIYGGSDEKPTVLGHDNLIMVANQVGPGAKLGNHLIFANCTHIGADAVVEDYVRMSSFISVEQGRKVGAYTFVSGYVQVHVDAPPFAMIEGSPYRVRGANSHNLKICGFGDDDIRDLKHAFREIYNGGGVVAKEEVLTRLLREDSTNPNVKELCEAIRAAKARAVSA
jgi:UDP-N-acetylglucosamine acyltransferase